MEYLQTIVDLIQQIIEAIQDFVAGFAKSFAFETYTSKAE